MDDSIYGKRNKRGDWSPNEKIEVAPLWRKPFSLMAVLKWIPNLLFPWSAFHLVTTLLYWFFVIPDMETMKTLSWDWGLYLLAVNMACVFVFYGAFEYLLYRKRTQANHFKYNGKFPNDSKSDVFWFNDQHIDNFLRTFIFSMPLWTLVEVLFLYAFAAGLVPWVSWTDNPYYLAALMLLAPAIHEANFFCIHWVMHQEPIYKWVHKIHHNSINPTPWSSLSMHPVEGFLYHAVAFWHLVIPSNPIVAIYQLHMAGFGAINGHFGFDRIELGKSGKYIPSEAFPHYLHHKHFDVNYGGEGLVPLDLWAGTWHDGTKEGDALMAARFKKKKEKMAAKSGS